MKNGMVLLATMLLMVSCQALDTESEIAKAEKGSENVKVQDAY